MKGLEDKSNEAFKHNFAILNIIGIHDTLKCQPQIKELPSAITEENEEYVKKLCSLFKERYNKELKYRFDRGVCYFTYERTLK